MYLKIHRGRGALRTQPLFRQGAPPTSSQARDSSHAEYFNPSLHPWMPPLPEEQETTNKSWKARYGTAQCDGAHLQHDTHNHIIIQNIVIYYTVYFSIVRCSYCWRQRPSGKLKRAWVSFAMKAMCIHISTRYRTSIHRARVSSESRAAATRYGQLLYAAASLDLRVEGADGSRLHFDGHRAAAGAAGGRHRRVDVHPASGKEKRAHQTRYRKKKKGRKKKGETRMKEK